MNEDDEKRTAAYIAKITALMCVRKTKLKKLHARIAPVSRIGDDSDSGG